MEVAGISTLLSSIIEESKYNFDLYYFETDKKIQTKAKNLRFEWKLSEKGEWARRDLNS